MNATTALIRTFFDQGMAHSLVENDTAFRACAHCGQVGLTKTCPGERMTRRELNLLERIVESKWDKQAVALEEYNRAVERVRAFESTARDREEMTRLTYNPVQYLHWALESRLQYPHVGHEPIFLRLRGRSQEAFSEEQDWQERSPLTLKLSVERAATINAELVNAIGEIERARVHLENARGWESTIRYETWEQRDGVVGLNECPVTVHWTNEKKGEFYCCPLTLGDARRVSQKLAEVVREGEAQSAQLQEMMQKRQLEPKVTENRTRNRLGVWNHPKEGENHRMRP